MNTDIQILLSNASICTLHAGRLKMALDKTTTLFPITSECMKSLSIEELGYLEILTSRFSKLQDTMGNKIFPSLIRLITNQLEPLTFIDILNLMEKYNLIPSRSFWNEMRETRNHIAHEYPDNPEIMAHNLNNAQMQSRKLLDYWETLTLEIEKLVKKGHIS